MKKTLIIASTVVLALIIAAGFLVVRAHNSGAAPRTLDGRRVPLTESAEAVTVVHFWATWCYPCREELPAFARFAAKSKAMGVRVIPVAVEPDAKTVAQFLTDNHLPFESLFDPTGEFASMFNVEVLPTTIILDRRGLIVNMKVGKTEWDSPQFVAEMTQRAAAN